MRTCRTCGVTGCSTHDFPIKSDASQPTVCNECLSRGPVFNKQGGFLGFTTIEGVTPAQAFANVMQGLNDAGEALTSGRQIGIDMSRFDVALVRCCKSGRLAIATWCTSERATTHPRMIYLPFRAREDYVLSNIADDGLSDRIVAELRLHAHLIDGDATAHDTW